MKLPVCVLCFFIISLQYKISNGGLVNNFFERIHNTTQTVRKDVVNVLHLNKNQQDNKNDHKPDETLKTETKNNDEVIPKDKETPINGTQDNIDTEPTKKEGPAKEEDNKKIESPSTTAPVVSTSTQSANFENNSTTTDTPLTTTTEKDERAAMEVVCSKGYQRTSDGRCKRPMG